MSPIAEILASVVAESAAWREPHDRAILARAAMLAIYQQAFDAALCAREMGLTVGIAERSGDAVELSFRGGTVCFRRSERNDVWSSESHAHRTGVVDRELPLPGSVAVATEWAEARVAEALRSLTG